MLLHSSMDHVDIGTWNNFLEVYFQCGNIPPLPDFNKQAEAF